MVKSAILGFPRIGGNRELKKATEAFWSGRLTETELQSQAAALRRAHWSQQTARGVDIIPVGDFSLYDHILDLSVTIGAVPPRYAALPVTPLERYFAMARGLQRPASGSSAAVDIPACEMKKWFDSNYHYIVPELAPTTEFSVSDSRIVEQFKEALALGSGAPRPVVVGPLTFLLLAKPGRDAPAGFKPVSLLEKLVPSYIEIIGQLAKAGAEWVQIDEPALVLDAAEDLAVEFRNVYERLSKVGPKIMLTAYYGGLGANLRFVKELPVAGLHIDMVRGASEFVDVVDALRGKNTALELGLVDGRNVWKTDLSEAITAVRRAVEVLGADRVIVATSSSLLHIPHTLEREKKLDAGIKDWLAFALEKCTEVSVIARGAANPDSVAAECSANKTSVSARRESLVRGDPAVAVRSAAITPAMNKRASPFPIRQRAQRAKLQLPAFPTTTIGSFPQTTEIRVARQRLNRGEITSSAYEEFLEAEIRNAVKFQERIGLDMLVHGEPERNDMVQYFAEQLNGFIVTENGWVQSFGTRCVRPPIVVGDISRRNGQAMTVRWSAYAQSVTQKPMKGMLTGPVTMLNWSFPRVDRPKSESARQLGLALRDEVCDLEAAGLAAIQVDEPAIREGLPLRKADWSAYLDWAVSAFKLATAGVTDTTQIHSHFCYSDFTDMMRWIQEMDADVISIEYSKSDAKLLEIFSTVGYANEIGPGLFDIHSPRVPSVEEMYGRLEEVCRSLPKENIWVNPDCGLKTRGWKECELQCSNMVEVARTARERLLH